MKFGINMVEVTSSMVSAIGHDGQNMYVTYKSGKTFMYKNVPYNLYESAFTAPSVGIHINAFIKGGSYEYVEVMAEPEPQYGEAWTNEVEVELIGELVPSTEFAAGYDLKAGEDVIVPAGGQITVGTGVHIGMPDLVAALVVPRSGLSHKHGITVLNGPGLIDPDYTKMVGVILHNTSNLGYHVVKGERIAQLLFVPFVRPQFKKVEAITPKESVREGGFGSTGK